MSQSGRTAGMLCGALVDEGALDGGNGGDEWVPSDDERGGDVRGCGAEGVLTTRAGFAIGVSDAPDEVAASIAPSRAASRTPCRTCGGTAAAIDA